MEHNVVDSPQDDENPSSNPGERLTSSDVVSRCLQSLVTQIRSLHKRLQYSVRKDINSRVQHERFTVLKSSLTIYIIVFLVSICVNKTTFYGRCIGKVDYSLQRWKTPFYSPLGYAACENNTYIGATDVTFHSPIDYDGYPSFPITQNEPFHNYGAGPDSRTLHVMGSMDTNFVRLYGEWFRFFTAMMLHGGWMHLLNNSFVHIIVLYIIEPDWGFYRTVVAYLVTGCGGYLVGSVFVPCLQQVGSSGIQLGFLGCIMPYCVEHWYNMGYPDLIILLSIGVSFADFIIVERDISKHIHMGGYFFGVLFGFSTIKSVAMFDRGAFYQRLMMRICSRWLSEETKQIYQSNILSATQAEDMVRMQHEHNAKKSANSYKFIKQLLGIYPYGPYRMRLRDVLTRIIAFTILLTLMILLLLGLHQESIYSGLNANATPLFSSNCKCCYIKKDASNSKLVATLEGKYYCFNSTKYAEMYC